MGINLTSDVKEWTVYLGDTPLGKIGSIVDISSLSCATSCKPEKKLYQFTDIFGKKYSVPLIKRVMFQNPATIIFWEDGDKTIVKCDECDAYFEHIGMADAIMKKAFGSRSVWLKHNRDLKKELSKLPFTEIGMFDEFDLALHYVDKLYTENKFSDMVERYMRKNYGV